MKVRRRRCERGAGQVGVPASSGRAGRSCAGPGPPARSSRRAVDAVAQATVTATAAMTMSPTTSRMIWSADTRYPMDPLGRVRMWCGRVMHHEYYLHAGRMVLPCRLAGASGSGC